MNHVDSSCSLVASLAAPVVVIVPGVSQFAVGAAAAVRRSSRHSTAADRQGPEEGKCSNASMNEEPNSVAASSWPWSMPPFFSPFLIVAVVVVGMTNSGCAKRKMENKRRESQSAD